MSGMLLNTTVLREGMNILYHEKDKCLYLINRKATDMKKAYKMIIDTQTMNPIL